MSSFYLLPWQIERPPVEMDAICQGSDLIELIVEGLTHFSLACCLGREKKVAIQAL